jgi:two-component system response regulator CpxR
MNVLMVDDDTELCEMVTEYLKLEGFHVTAVHDGQSGIEAAQNGDYALMLLDVMLPRKSGIEVLRSIRSGGGASAALPILMLTARGDARDRVLGLEVGADDYLPKPFDERELVARVRAILRRAGQSTPSAPTGAPAVLRVGDVEANIGARRAQCGGVLVQLTSVEFDLLVMLLRDAGNVVGREEIAQRVLGRPLLHFDRSIDTHISRLRRKLGPHPDGGERIVTLRGVGYIYTLPAADEK